MEISARHADQSAPSARSNTKRGSPMRGGKQPGETKRRNTKRIDVPVELFDIVADFVKFVKSAMSYSAGATPTLALSLPAQNGPARSLHMTLRTIDAPAAVSESAASASAYSPPASAPAPAPVEAPVQVLRGTLPRPATSEQLQLIEAAKEAGARSDQARLEQADMLTTTAFAKRFGMTRETVHKRIKTGKLLALPKATRGLKLPAKQMGKNELPLPGLTELLAEIDDRWEAFQLLDDAHPLLGNRTGWEALADGDSKLVIDLGTA